ncbi:hypothetical protein TGMAS_288465 [Toxoplasma gondii MAS]|uniref:Uncharacterized protein n=1 Tax=Toxoplasma gondii MAS TaxID=943118 RepID=A0A086QHP4_TOXGO|nr:hypothetical protein TGMAS_288465 [Toxoplasma gondii MAS]
MTRLNGADARVIGKKFPWQTRMTKWDFTPLTGKKSCQLRAPEQLVEMSMFSQHSSETVTHRKTLKSFLMTQAESERDQCDFTAQRCKRYTGKFLSSISTEVTV